MRHRIIRTAALIRQKKGMMLSPSESVCACVCMHARGQQTAEDWIVMHGGGRRNNMPHTGKIVAPPDFHPFMFAGPNELIQRACTYTAHY